MIKTLGIFLATVFLFLSCVHFYWAFGGQWGFQGAIPSNEEGIPILNPKPIESGIVGLFLLLFALFYSIKIGVLSIALPRGLLLYGGWILPAIFLLRVLGDMKYVGLFKKIKLTEFAMRDTAYYIPLCAILAVIGFIVQLYNKTK